MAGTTLLSADIDLQVSDYVHLHNHTYHSLLDGLTKINDLSSAVKNMGMEACAITDHGTMSGVVEFYKSCKDEGIKPIIGIETYVAARSRHDRDPQKDKARHHLILLAMNNVGYHNLMQISTKANLEGMYYKPRVDRELLEEFNEGIIALSACASGEVGGALRDGNYAEAKKIASWYKSVFGDRYYLELQDHGHPDCPHAWDVQVEINKGLIELSNELDIECVVTSDAHYLSHGNSDAHEILLCVGTGSFLSDEKRMSLKEFDLHVMEPQEIIDRWKGTHPRAIANTKVIADRCNVELDLGGILIPKFPVPEGEDEKTYLDKLVYRGMAQRYAQLERADTETMSPDDIRPLLSQVQQDRLDMELDVLDRMGYNGYFLIVQDFINWGKDQGIVFGPGRGSAAGSIIAYSLRITDLDPLKYDLLFERFLNPDRISMPDIDIDIQDTRRDEVIQYCAEKYGSSRVANICTFGKMAAKASVKDVARVLEVPYAEADRFSKLIPPPVQGRNAPLRVSIENDPDLKKEYETNPVAKRVFDFAMILEGTIRSHGVHAAGVVIAPDDIVRYAPLEMSQKGVVATQFPMGPIEEIGLLKMDFLGLSNLTTINNALRIIKKVYGTKIDLDTLPLDDAKTYELFQRGDTTGVFQLESAGMKRYLRELKPTVFEDIIAIVALYRPGPMQFIDSFIKRKHGQEEITYLDKGMENALSPTYGILVYQEQFMQISKEWCGFTGGQADTLRKAVGKKNIDLMRKVKVDFVKGAVEISGAKPDVAELFWSQLEEFANYCFNKSHAACYGLIAYWTAYLKAHFPDAFMAALMTSDRDDTDRLALEIAECNHMGLKVLAPDVNQSYVDFAIVPEANQIRFGMAAVKGVGQAAVEEILQARSSGKFVTIEDFARRVSTRKFNKKAWDSLIKTGGFDEFGDRDDLLFNLETLQGFASKVQKEAASGQTDLFGDLGGDHLLPSVSLQTSTTKTTDKEKLMWERELLGLYISAHPLDNYATYFEEQTMPLSHMKPILDNKRATIGGIILGVRTIITKTGSKMAFVQIEDKTSEAEVIVFPNLFEQCGAKLQQDVVIRVGGKISARDRDGNLGDEAKMIADEVIVVDEEELKNYESTGRKMETPRANAQAVRAQRVKMSGAKLTQSTSEIPSKNSSEKEGLKKEDSKRVRPISDMPLPKKVFVQIKDVENHEHLLALKEISRRHMGSLEVILVLGEGDQKSAMRLPFRVDGSDQMVQELAVILGNEAVVLK